ncbi:energy transducer TonB [Sulfurospirillum sp. 1612]|uniref:energy transducer TonB n=1 Tax=Sulfurospirillum sp. 1612 TaxID=3094835 RepID=UPI002F934691
MVKKPQEVVQEHISKPIVTKTTNKIIKQDQQEDSIKEQKRLRFIIKLRERINHNKFYPNRAIKMGIEGSVAVEFMLNEDGSITNIHVLSGQKVFRNSACKAIEDSAPIHVEAGLFDFPKQFKVTLVYDLQ